MKKICLSLLIVILLSGCAGNSSSKETIVLPPSRIGTEGYCSFGSWPNYSFEDAYRESAVVARVKVGNWLGDTGDFEDSFDITYFEATTVKCFKGEISDSFVLIQYGSSKVTVRGYPLYAYGDELLVFLQPSEGPDDPDEVLYFDNSYWLTGAYDTYLAVAYDEAGKAFYVDCRDHLGKTMSLTGYKDLDLALALRNEMASRDPIYARASFYHIFSEADVEQLLLSFDG